MEQMEHQIECQTAPEMRQRLSQRTRHQVIQSYQQWQPPARYSLMHHLTRFYFYNPPLMVSLFQFLSTSPYLSKHPYHRAVISVTVLACISNSPFSSWNQTTSVHPLVKVLLTVTVPIQDTVLNWYPRNWSYNSLAWRQKDLTGCCFKYIDRPFCLWTNELNLDFVLI